MGCDRPKNVPKPEQESAFRFARRTSAVPIENRASRIAYIDGLRAVAVLSVVACHAAIFSPPFDRQTHSLAGYLLHLGSHGVDLFFVLSGFCLAYPTIARTHRDGTASFNVPQYAARRLVRIIPPYYAAIAFLLFAAFELRRFNMPLPISLDVRGGVNEICRQLLFFDSGTPTLNWSFWTLAYEFRWYAMFPIMLLLYARSRRAFALVLCLAAASSVTLDATRGLLSLPEFSLGIVAADWHIRGHRFARYAALAFPVLLLFGTYIGRFDDWLPPPQPNVIWQLAMFSLVVAAGSWSTLRSILSMRWLTFIGVASYSIYLIHQPVIMFAEQQREPVMIAAAAGVAAGIAFWAFAERPFVSTPLRDQMIRELDVFLPRWGSLVGIPVNMNLRSATIVPAIEPSADIEIGRTGVSLSSEKAG